MAIRATEGLAPSWFTPASEEGSERPTRFQLKPLTGAEQDEVLEGANIEGGVIHLAARGIRAALRHGLVGWENFDDSRGAVPFSPAAVDRLPWMYRKILASEILNRSDLTGAEVKNS